jgi:hypothetical protein
MSLTKIHIHINVVKIVIFAILPFLFDGNKIIASGRQCTGVLGQFAWVCSGALAIFTVARSHVLDYLRFIIGATQQKILL